MALFSYWISFTSQHTDIYRNDFNSFKQDTVQFKSIVLAKCVTYYTRKDCLRLIFFLFKFQFVLVWERLFLSFYILRFILDHLFFINQVLLKHSKKNHVFYTLPSKYEWIIFHAHIGILNKQTLSVQTLLTVHTHAVRMKSIIQCDMNEAPDPFWFFS